MEVSSQDPPLVAMDLSKSFSVAPLTCSHPEAMDLAKKPEWYHRRPASCSTEMSSAFRTRASSSYGALPSRLHPEPAAPVHCRDVEQRPESLGNYVGSSLARGLDLDLYRDGVHRNLWHSGFYGHDQSGSPVPESSGGDESDSGSDVIFLVSSTKEPLLCGSFIQDGVGHIVEALSPTASSPDDGRGCYHLPQPLSSPSPDSSSSEDSSDSSVDIPLHHARPVVLLSDLSAIYGNHLELPVDISSDSSDVIEVSVTHDETKSSSCKRGEKSQARETPPRSDDGRSTPSAEVRRSSRIRKSVSEVVRYTRSPSRHSLKRQAKNSTVGIYNESCDSDDMIEYAARLSSSDADEMLSQPKAAQGLGGCSEGPNSTDVVDRKSPPPPLPPPPLESEPSCNAPNKKSVSCKQKKTLSIRKVKMLKRVERKQKSRVTPEEFQKAASTKPAARRKKKRHSQVGPAAWFPPCETEIDLKFVKVREAKREKREAGFCPFVHMEKRTCTVVNDQEEAARVRSSRGVRQPASRGSLSGFVPNTSCFQLGHLSSESRCQATLLCCLCGQTANTMGLGDLHGPYLLVGPSDRQNHDERSSGLGTDSSVQPSEDRQDGESGDRSSSLECWIHEDCGIWSAGVFLVRGKLYGLKEAARLAQETVSAAGQEPSPCLCREQTKF